jgi:signal transduction histidine kinase
MERKRQTVAVKQNGTKQQTAPVQPTPDQVVDAMQRAVARVRRMSHQQRVQSLKNAGILTTAGKLAAVYR